MNRLSLNDRARILGCLVEGNSMRATTRMCGVSLNTVSKLLIEVGAACDLYQNETLKNLPCKRVQVDEIYSFCRMKSANVPPNREGVLGYGDVYTWVAIDADTKLVPSWLVGQRTPECAVVFMKDLVGRLANRVQLTTDGFRPYVSAVEQAFGSDVDYAMLVKIYRDKVGRPAFERKYADGECCGSVKTPMCGNPDEQHISTSYVERQNLTMRMGMKRYARRGNGFSKKIENHAHAVALHYMYYNFGRVHKTLRVTPAMETGISDHIWSLQEIADLAS